jgi:minor extracellular serine protease Vpr
MSTASPSAIKGFDSQQVGTGLIQPRVATVAQAFAWTTNGLNSLRFGMNQLSGSHSETESFKITNSSKKTVTYDLSSTLSKSYGADVTITPKRVSVKAGKTVTVRVNVKLSTSDVAKLPGAEANENGALVSLRGLVVAKPRSPRAETPTLRTAFLLVPVPLSSVEAPSRVTQTSAGTVPPLRVRNSGVHRGSADVYQWLLSDPAGDVADNEAADLTNVGVQSLPYTEGGTSDRLLVFAASQAGGTSTQATRETDILIDTDDDGTADFLVAAADTGAILSGTFDGTVSSFTVNLETGDFVDVWSASAPANGSTVLLPVLASSLGVNATSKALGVGAEGLGFLTGGVDRVEGVGYFNAFAPALSQGDLVTLAPGRSASIPLTVNQQEVGRQSTAGWLVVTPDDKSGYAETDRVALRLRGAPVSPARQAPLVVTNR